MGKQKYNWSEIQKFYDAGNTWRDIHIKYGMSNQSIHKATLRGDLKLRNKSEATILNVQKYGTRKHTLKTKQKISESRLKFLKENPDKVPYLVNHSSKKSYPEIVFENALISSEITGWKYRFQNGIYQYDFAFPEQKIDVEIDGGTHLTEKVKKIDARRDEFSRQCGWIVIRFTADQVKKDVVGCIQVLRKFL
jgi:very-short-patch-repair endonuclease